MTKMHPDEVDIDVGLARRLVGSQFSEWAELPLSTVEPWGTDNAIFRLGEGAALRLPRTPGTVLRLLKELEWLPRVAPFLPLEAPVPLARGEPSAEYPFPWAVCRWVEGEPAEHVSADELAALVGALQRLDLPGGPGPGEHNAYRGVPLARRDGPTRAAIDALRGEVDVAAVVAAWEEALHAPEWEGPPVWIHGDLDSRNLLVRDGRLSGVVDFGCLGVGDPATDAMLAWKLFGGHERDDFRRALGVDDATWERSRGWALSQAVIALAYYTLETNPTLVGEARRWLAEALE